MADNQHAHAKIGHLVLRIDELVSFIEHLQGEAAQKDAVIAELKEFLLEYQPEEEDEPDSEDAPFNQDQE